MASLLLFSPRKNKTKPLPYGSLLNPILVGLFAIFAAATNPAQALRCSITKQRIDIALCSNPELRQADQDLNDAYLSLLKSRDADEQRVISLLQRDWLPERARCDKESGVDLACLGDTIRRQIDFLRAANGQGGNDRARLTFKGYYATPETQQGVVISVSVYEFATPDSPGKKLFNLEAEKLLAQEQSSDAENTGGASADSHCPGNCEITVKMGPPFLNQDFISAPVKSWEYLGGAHGAGDTSYINIFLADDKRLQFDDLFLDYDAPKLAKECYDQIMSQYDVGLPMASTGGDDPRPSNVFMKAFRNLDNWYFTGDQARITFGLYALGPYAAGTQMCEISYAHLKPHVSSSHILPTVIQTE